MMIKDIQQSMIKYGMMIPVLLCVWLFSYQHSNAQCTGPTDVTQGGNMMVSTTTANTTSPYLQYYILVDNTGAIVAANDDGNFATSGLTVGDNYSIHALNFDSGDAPSPLTSGAPSPSQLTGNLSGITGGCFDDAATTGLIDDEICVRIVAAACASTLTICEGDPLIQTTSGGTVGDPLYTTVYYLVNTSDNLVDAFNTTGTFTPDVVGGQNYQIHALNYLTSDQPMPLPAIDDMLSVVGTTSMGCFNSDFTTDYVCVTVNALPTAMIAASGTVISCSATSLTLTASGGTSYAWSTADGNITSATNIAAITVDAAGTYEVTVTDGNNCTDTENVVITGDAVAPTATVTPANPVCPNVSGTGSITIDLAAATGYSYDIVANSIYNGIATSGTATAQSGMQEVIANAALPGGGVVEGGAAQDYTIRVFDATNACFMDYTVTLTPPATCVTSCEATLDPVCMGQGSIAGNLTAGSWESGSDYALIFYLVNTMDGTIEAISGDEVLTGMYDFATTGLTAGISYQIHALSYNTTDVPSFYPLAVDAVFPTDLTSATGCFNADFLTSYVCVNVVAPPTAAIAASGTVISCSATSLTLTASGGTSYAWSTADGNITSATNIAAITVDAAGTYEVTVTDGNNCTDTENVVVTGNTMMPTPVDAPFMICQDEISTNLTLNDNIVLDSETGTVAWYDGDPNAGGILISPAIAVNLNMVTDLWAEVTLTDNSCQAAVNITVTITPTPTAAIDSNNGSICEGSDAIFTLSGTPNATVTYSINGATVTTVALDPTGAGMITVVGVSVDQVLNVTNVSIGTSPNDCSAVLALSSTVTVEMMADAGNNASLNVCNDAFGGSTTLDLVTPLGVADAGVWAETTSSGVSLADPTNVEFNGVTPGTYTFTYTVTGTSPCPNDIATITVVVEDCTCPTGCDELQFPWNGNE